MKLDAFIQYQRDAILDEWEIRVQAVLPPPRRLANDADFLGYGKSVLAQIAGHLQSAPADEGGLADGKSGTALDADAAADGYAASRHQLGFEAAQVIHELGLVRSSVLELWRDASPSVDFHEAVAALVAFDRALDQVLGRTVQSFLSKAAASRDIFLAVLAHDLRSPLHGIAMAGSLLAAAKLPESTRIQTAERVVRATKIMQGLIADLLEFTRSRLGVGMPVERSSADLRQVCEEALELARGAAPQREFAHHFSGELHAQVDYPRIRQVLSNLLNNAVQHGDETAPISLTATGAEDAIVLTVSNFGKPIPAEAARIIFEPLVQVPITTTDPSKRLKDSLGLGLFIAREIVEGHGGTISVDSSAEGGTRFAIRLPRVLQGHR
jgi:signal transduction histidine kinase